MDLQDVARQQRRWGFNRLTQQMEAARVEEIKTIGERMAGRLPRGKEQMDQLVMNAIDSKPPAEQFRMIIYFGLHPRRVSLDEVLSR